MVFIQPLRVLYRPPTQHWLKNYSPSKWPSTDIFLEDCKSCNA